MAEDDIKPGDDPQGSEPEPEQAPPLEPAEEPLAGADEAGEGAGEPAPDAEAGEQDAKEPAKKLSPGALSLCRSAIEAMLFSSAEPVAARKLADALKHTGVESRGVRRIIRELAQEYEQADRGFTIDEVAGGFKMQTRLEYAEYVGSLIGGGHGGRLSQAALETLAVVAYRQPVIRADIEAIRGVQAGPLLRSLLHKGLVRITGRAELIGRPLLYGTTRKFLEHFGLKSLNELPKVEELPKP